MKFNYQARTKTGEIRSGVVEASTKEAALNLLQRYGLYVTSLEVEKEPLFFKKIKIFGKIRRKDLVLFSRQLAIMFQSNVPPIDALQTLASQTKNPVFKEKIARLSEEVEGGTTLSQALALYPDLFSSFYVSMVKSGEAVGRLPETLNHLADHLEKEYHFRSRVIGAMIYPSLVLLVFLVVLFAMIFFIMPQLIEVLEATGGELPSITKTTIAVTNFLRSYGLIIILIFIFLIIFLFRFYKSKKGKDFFDRIFLKIPFLGEFLKKNYLSRFAENLSTLIAGGLPIAEALEITGQVIGNNVYQKIVFETRERVRRGEAISLVLRRFPEAISPFFIQMILVGEKTGRIESTLTNVVDFYRKEIDRDLDRLLGLLEPLVIIFLGVLVGGLVGSILLPLYRIGIT
jgi:type IV pilus assembly protein PilC